MSSNEVLVITGMSGAGKSTVSHALEDLGWYVVDNLPPSMIASLCEMAAKTPSAIAVVIDVDLDGVGVVAIDVGRTVQILDVAGGVQVVIDVRQRAGQCQCCAGTTQRDACACRSS